MSEEVLKPSWVELTAPSPGMWSGHRSQEELERTQLDRNLE